MSSARLAAADFGSQFRIDAKDRVTCRGCTIRDLVFCGGVPAPYLDMLETGRDVIQVPEGHTLHVEGEAAAKAYLVKGGALRLCRLLPDGRRQITDFGLAGDWLGLARDGRYVHTLQAVVPSTLCEFPVEQVDSLAKKYPEVENLLRRQWQSSLVASQDQILMLGRMNPIEKLSSFLVRLYERRETVGLHGNPVYLPMSRTDIADYLGVTIETVSRSTSRLRRMGLIEPLDRNRVQLLDLAGLRRQAGM